MRKYQSHQRGNVLFLILLGVVLFAALSYAVTQSFDGGNSALSKSSLKAYANDVIFSAANVEKAVNKLISKGVSENRISFNRKSGDGYNVLPPSSIDSEKVFNVAGGGANYLDPPPDVLDSTHNGENGFGEWFFTGSNVVVGVGNSNEDLVAILPYVRKDVCTFINNQLGYPNVDTATPPQDELTMNVASKFIGLFNSNTRTLAPAGTSYEKKKTGCVQGNNDHSGSDISDKYYFYYVLYAR